MKVGLVCFRLIGSNQLNQKLLTTINASGRLHMVIKMVLIFMIMIRRKMTVMIKKSESKNLHKCFWLAGERWR